MMSVTRLMFGMTISEYIKEGHHQRFAGGPIVTGYCLLAGLMGIIIVYKITRIAEVVSSLVKNSRQIGCKVPPCKVYSFNGMWQGIS